MTAARYALAGGHALEVETTTRADGTTTATLRAASAELLERCAGGEVELHWATRTVDGDGTWTRAPRGVEARTGRREFGDGIASRSAFDASGTLTLTMDRSNASEGDVEGVENVGSIVGIVVCGEFWAHAEGGDLEIKVRESTAGGAGGRGIVGATRRRARGWERELVHAILHG